MNNSPSSALPGEYSVANAERFGWSSISGDLNRERVAHLQTYLVGQTILDAGCGGGAFVDFLTRQGLDVTGVDLHASFLSVGKERGYQGRFVQGDVTDLALGDKEFDCAYCFDVLEHVDDQAALRELARVTKRRILLAVPRQNQEFAPYSLTFLHYQDATHLRYYTEDSLRALAETVRPRQVQVFPELFIGVGEMVRELARFDRDRLKGRIANLLADITRAAQGAADETGEKNEAIDNAVPPPYPSLGIRSRVRAWAVDDPLVRRHFRETYRPAGDMIMTHYAERAGDRAQARASELVDALADEVIETILFEAEYPAIPTGLVAVINL